MADVILTRVFRKDVETKYGIKPKVSIQTNLHGDKWLSTFKVAGTENWNEGDAVSIDIQEKGDFINFNPRNDGGSRSSSSPALEARVEKLERAVFGPPTSSSEEVIQADDLPDLEEEDDGF